jgi:hypothetical protein
MRDRRRRTATTGTITQTASLFSRGIMGKFLLWSIVLIFVIGLLVVFGILDLIF